MTMVRLMYPTESVEHKNDFVVLLFYFVQQNRAEIVGQSFNRSVQHDFDTRIEQLRSELRGNEERIRSQLRDKEAEIGALRSAVLSGSVNRQSLLDKRRF